MDELVRLSHGDGGSETFKLIKKVFLNNFGLQNTSLQDSFVFNTESRKMAYTTDTFVVKPLFFRGGDIGKLAICGTVNDLAASGATPLYISVGFVIEEGFGVDKLNIIAKSMGDACRSAGARIVTGDTKVVERGSADGVYINTSGIGMVSNGYMPRRIEPGDEVIITGSIGEHGTSILLDRYNMSVETVISSDCAPMQDLIKHLDDYLIYVKAMKDPTRGGLATSLNEIANEQKVDIELEEKMIPVKKEVKAINDILGTDPFYMACEGRMIIITEKSKADALLKRIRNEDARIIGRVASGNHGLVYMNTFIGGKRIVPALDGGMLPRIC